MEGPTPVSALIHAATMVTAGVFLMIRCSFFFDISPTVMAFVQIIGAFTALSAALTAIFIYDIKKIIAYSTCSQLGYMILACGLHQYTIGFFHLINHAFFKALLFLTAGAIIHSFNNEQDIRKIAGVSYTAPLLHSALLIGSWAIMGLPFFSGYYSKDAIIELVYIYGKKTVLNSEFSINYLYLLILIATFCTGVYSVRLYYYLFIREGAFLKDIKKIEQPFFINLVIVILMLGSIFSGYCISDLFSLSNATFENIKYRPWVQYAVRSDNYDRLRFTSDFEHYFKTKAMGEEAQAEEFVTAPVWMQKRLGWGPKTLVERDFVGYSDKHHDEMPVLPYGGNSDHHVRIAIEDESSPRYMRAYTSTTLVDPAAPFSCYFNSLKGMKNIVDYHPKKLPRKDWEHMNRIINAYINDPSVGRYLKGVKLAPNGMPYQRKWNDKKDIESNQLWLVDETDPILLNHFNETGEIYENREDRTFHYADGTATIGWAVEGMLPVAIPELSRVPFYKDKTRDPEYDSMFLIGKVGKLPVLGINTNSKLGGKASDEELGAYGRGICPYWKEENAFDPNLYDAQVEFLPWYIKLAPLFCNLLSMFGGLFFIYLYQLGIIPKYYQLILASLDDRYKENILIKQYFSRLALRLLDMYFKTVKKFIRIVQKNYLFNELYSYFSLWSLQRIFYDMVANFDKGLLLYAGPKGAFWLYMKLSKKFIKFFNMGWKYHLFILYNTFIIFTLIIFFMV